MCWGFSGMCECPCVQIVFVASVFYNSHKSTAPNSLREWLREECMSKAMALCECVWLVLSWPQTCSPAYSFTGAFDLKSHKALRCSASCSAKMVYSPCFIIYSIITYNIQRNNFIRSLSICSDDMLLVKYYGNLLCYIWGLLRCEHAGVWLLTSSSAQTLSGPHNSCKITDDWFIL